MQTVLVKPLYHRGCENIGIYFTLNNVISSAIRRIKGIKWSKTYKCWYIPLEQQYYFLLKEALQPIAVIDDHLLRAYLQQRKVIVKNKAVATIPERQPVVNQTTVKALMELPLCPENLEAYEQYQQMLQLKAYSNSTFKTYCNEFYQLLKLLGHVPVSALTEEQLKRYLQYCLKKLNLGEFTVHSRINAIKFYFEKVLGRDKMFFELPRPKKPLVLPKVMGERELGRLFNALENRKHKALLFTAYSAGLRVSEVVHLQLSHIDSSRMQIFVERAKGKKDRYVGLSPVLLDVLRAYLKEMQPRPKKYLFEGQFPAEQYSTKSAQRVFQLAREKAGIQKAVSFHALRHSFATHLLEKGVDIRYIKDLLGHFNIKTTERYLHVKKEQLVNIVSPLDDLWKREKIDW